MEDTCEGNRCFLTQQEPRSKGPAIGTDGHAVKVHETILVRPSATYRCPLVWVLPADCCKEVRLLMGRGVGEELGKS